MIALTFATPSRLLYLAFPLFLAHDPAFRLSPLRTTLLKATTCIQLILGRSSVYPLGRSGAKILVDRNDIVSRIFFLRGAHESDVTGAINRLVHSGMTFFDVGANIGFFSLLASKIVGPRGRVHSFEPEQRNFSRLRMNMRLSMSRNIVANRMALTDRAGHVQLNIIGKDGWGRFSSLGKPAVGISVTGEATKVTVEKKVRSSTLTEYAKHRGVRQIHVMKLDVEGAELSVLKGGREILARERAPHLICEFSATTTRSFGYDLETLRRYVESLGYKLYRIADAYGHLEPLRKNPGVQGTGYANFVASKANEPYLLDMHEWIS